MTPPPQVAAEPGAIDMVEAWFSETAYRATVTKAYAAHHLRPCRSRIGSAAWTRSWTMP
jgi:hypothetical protein